MAENDLPPKSIQGDMDAIAAWTQARIGKATASNIWRVLKRTKKDWSAERYNYKMELIAERLTGIRQDIFLNSYMLHGVETEPDAIRAYMRGTKCEVTPVQPIGFVDHPIIPNTGASPDGLVEGGGLIEVKCPQTKTHVEIIMTKQIPEKYVQQMLWQLACLPDRNWVDFVSYDPRLPKELRLYRFRLEREPKTIDLIEQLVAEFQDEIEAELRALGPYTPPVPKIGDGREQYGSKKGVPVA